MNHTDTSKEEIPSEQCQTPPEPIPDHLFEDICQHYEELMDHPYKYLFSASQWLRWYHHYQQQSDTFALKLMRRVVQSGTLHAFRTLQFVPQDFHHDVNTRSCNDNNIDINYNINNYIYNNLGQEGSSKDANNVDNMKVNINKEELIQSACHVQYYSDQLAAKCISESLKVRPIFGKTKISIFEGDCLEVAIHLLKTLKSSSVTTSSATSNVTPLSVVDTSSFSSSQQSLDEKNKSFIHKKNKKNSFRKETVSTNSKTIDSTCQEPPLDFENDSCPSDMVVVVEQFKVALLNMASAKRPGGGYREGAGSQEENLFRRTSLAFSLEDIESYDSQRQWYYPIEKHGGVYVPSVQVIRGSESKGYPFLNEIYTLDVVCVAALRTPKLDHTGTRIDASLVDTVRRKIRLIFAMALQHGVTHLVLSAFGCGAYRNPPQHVAQLFKQVLMQEFDGKFAQVIFAIYNDANAWRRGDGGNVEPFEKEFGIKASVFEK